MRLDDCYKKGLLRSVDISPEMVDRELSRAHHHLQNARQCIDDDMPDLAVVSVYTSMFHTARALLFRDGIKERSHVCILEYLKEKYPQLHDFVPVMDMYRRSRHTMLYGTDAEVISDDAVEGMRMAEMFVNAVQKLL